MSPAQLRRLLERRERAVEINDLTALRIIDATLDAIPVMTEPIGYGIVENDRIRILDRVDREPPIVARWRHRERGYRAMLARGQERIALLHIGHV